MTRRAQKPKRAVKRAQAEAIEPTLDSQQGAYRAPDRASCDEQDILTFVPHPTDTVRTQGRAWTQGGRVVDFYIAVQVQTSINGPWMDETTLDCKHGHLHSHRHADGIKGGASHFQRLDDVADLKQALGVAILYAQDREDSLRTAMGGDGNDAH